MRMRLMLLALIAALHGCAQVEQYGGPVAGAAGGVWTASELDLLEAQYFAGALIAWSIYDPLAPTWRIRVTQIDEQRYRFDLTMRSLVTGGAGEARQVFLRNARSMVEEQGHAGFDIMSYEEGIESTRPFARRVAAGEIRVAHSATWPNL